MAHEPKVSTFDREMMGRCIEFAEKAAGTKEFLGCLSIIKNLDYIPSLLVSLLTFRISVIQINEQI